MSSINSAYENPCNSSDSAQLRKTNFSLPERTPKNNNLGASRVHHSVLLLETINILSPHDNEVYLDLTAGYGGHAQAMLSAAHLSSLILRDRDDEAISYLEQRFATNDHVRVEKGDFLDLNMADNSIDMILLDLGVSSPQLDQASRGFSYQKESLLDMRQDRTQPIKAYDLVNFSDKDTLVRILRAGSDLDYKLINRIAQLILSHRGNSGMIRYSSELVSLISNVRSTKIDSVKKQVFQAFRIEVNQELYQLESVLPHLLKILKSGGRLAILSFHSKEDKIVKSFFKECTTPTTNIIGQLIKDAPAISLTHKAIKASQNDPNSRARSVRLRAIQKK